MPGIARLDPDLARRGQAERLKLALLRQNVRNRVSARIEHPFRQRLSAHRYPALMRYACTGGHQVKFALARVGLEERVSGISSCAAYRSTWKAGKLGLAIRRKLA